MLFPEVIFASVSSIKSADCLGSIDTFGAQIQQQEVVVSAARHQVELASDWCGGDRQGSELRI